MIWRGSFLPAGALALALGTALAGCGDDGPAAPTNAIHTADNGDVFNDADADFATSLIKQHAVSLVLVDLARTAGASTEITRLGEGVLAARAPEIEEATDWLLVWDLPVPETIRDHGNAGHGPVEQYDDPELDELADLEGVAFDQRWLELMIGQHQDAIELAEAELDDGRYEPALTLAQALADDQRARIEELQALLPE